MILITKISLACCYLEQNMAVYRRIFPVWVRGACPRIHPLRFLAGCRRRRLNQGLVVALGFLSLLDKACFCVIFSVYGCMLCLVRYLFVISTSVIDCPGRFVPEMTYYVSSGTLNLAQLNSTDVFKLRFVINCLKKHK